MLINSFTYNNLSAILDFLIKFKEEVLFPKWLVLLKKKIHTQSYHSSNHELVSFSTLSTWEYRLTKCLFIHLFLLWIVASSPFHLLTVFSILPFHFCSLFSISRPEQLYWTVSDRKKWLIIRGGFSCLKEALRIFCITIRYHSKVSNGLSKQRGSLILRHLKWN